MTLIYPEVDCTCLAASKKRLSAGFSKWRIWAAMERRLPDNLLGAVEAVLAFRFGLLLHLRGFALWVRSGELSLDDIFFALEAVVETRPTSEAVQSQIAPPPP